MGRLSLSLHRFGPPAFLSASLLLCFLVLQNVHGALQQHSERLVERSASLHKVKRQSDKKHVSFPVTYSTLVFGEPDSNLYTDVTFGSGSQSIRLALSLYESTWVPQTPQSTAEFCNNATNAPGCRIVGNQFSLTVIEEFVFEQPYAPFNGDSYNLTATGRWTEDEIIINGVDVSLQFGVVNYWNTTPVLGLGGIPFYTSPNRPSYITALKQQGKIGETFCSIYYSGTTSLGGSIALGAVDTEKFTGKLKIFEGDNIPGEFPSPSARVVVGSQNNESAILTPQSLNATALSYIYTGFPGLSVPQELINLIPSSSKEPNLIVDIPCDYYKPDIDYLEFIWDDLSIRVPLVDIMLNVPNTAPEENRCFLYLADGTSLEEGVFSYIMGTPFFKSTYVVLNPETNTTAFGVSIRDARAENLIEPGGSFGTRLSDLRGATPRSTSAPPTRSPSSDSSKTPVGAIAGGVVGGVAVLAAVAGGLLLFRRRRNSDRRPNDDIEPPKLPQPEAFVPELASPETHLISKWDPHKVANSGVDGGAPPVELDTAQAPSNQWGPVELPGNTETYELPSRRNT
ncbi:Barrierpepsin [Orbilia brochopaga]|nr:Barrierpepsin [Drechslerella brochopaga]